MNKIIIRIASSKDVQRIADIDNEVYGQISNEVTSTKEIMEERVSISKGWFFVAERNGLILGYLSLCPTNNSPDDYKTWEESTDGGRLRSVYNNNGEYVYGVALTISKDGRGLGISDKLFAFAGKKMIIENKKLIYFCGRMPGFHKEKKMSAEEYYSATRFLNGKRVALDPQIRMYESFGLKKLRLVKDGFKGDKESRGYSVLFYTDIPFYNWPLKKFWGSIFWVIASNKYFVRVFT